MESLKVLMIGGLGCGKTSVLASIFDQMLNGATNTIFKVADRTNHVKEDQNILINKKLELIDFIEKGGDNTFIVDKTPTMCSWEYRMQIQIPETFNKYQIDFMDVPGNYYGYEPGGNRNFEEVEKFIKESSVFVIVIDTPFLMEGRDYENSLTNCIDMIHDLLALGCDGIKAKQVIFVPLKCEKWVQEENGYDKVVRKVEEVYSSTIKELKVRQTEISIIPIQTAGGIVFDSLKPAYRVVNDNDEIVVDKCSILNHRNIIDRNGNLHKLQLNESLEESNFCGIGGICRPIAWYRLKNNAQYRPYNCEQLPLHIMRFMFNKFKSEAGDRFLSTIFGSITVEDIQNCLDKLSKANLIKDNVEGIKTIKKCF